MDDIIANCTPVWVKVNLHFFAKDDCTGSLDPLYLVDNNGNVTQGKYIPPSDVYKVAENLINDANQFLINNHIQYNQAYWGVPVDLVPPCVPIRWYINKVRLHCNTTAKNTHGGNFKYFNDNFGEDLGSAINLYIVEYQGGSNGAAISTTMTIEELIPSLFNHEAGHILSLGHTFDDDGLDDTPAMTFTYDFNCDGDIQDYFGNATFTEMGVTKSFTLDEYNKKACWDTQTLRDNIDLDGNGSIDITNHGCNRQPPCEVFPCCKWEYQNNNIMSYGFWKIDYGAFTKGQIKKMLENLSTITKCNYIEYIGSCPPPAPILGILPFNFNGCVFCIRLEGTMQDDWYQLEIVDPTNTGSGSIVNTGWIHQPATEYCIGRNSQGGWMHNLIPGHTYEAILRVENFCGTEKSTSIQFTMPTPNCNTFPDPQDIVIQASPNPFQQNLDVAFTNPTSGRVMIYRTQMQNTSFVLLHDQNETAGSHNYTFNTTQWNNGIYSLVFVYLNRVKSIQIMKN